LGAAAICALLYGCGVDEPINRGALAADASPDDAGAVAWTDVGTDSGAGGQGGQPLGLLDDGASEITQRFGDALHNASRSQRAFEAADRFVRGWYVARDPTTGLYGQETTNPIWTPKNAAADLWSFMVLSTYFTDRATYFGDMRTTLESEIRLTSRLGALPDYFDLTTQAFRYETPSVSRIIFGAAEYAKDGLMPLLEVIGRGPYFDRMVSLEDGILQNAPFVTERGNLPDPGREVNGETMQVMTRLYFATADERYLDMAERIASYYLLDDHLGGVLRLLDHGSEIMGGLSEVYVAVKESGRDVVALRAALEQFYDRVLEVCRHEDGQLWRRVNLDTGEVVEAGIPDTWGYVFDGYYTFWMVEGKQAYRDAVLRALTALSAYEDHNWGNADAYADTVESAIVLANREPVPEVLSFVESQVDIMFSRQQDSGIIEGWWGDGNFARTALMYALMKTQGVYTDNWRSDLRFGATRADDTLYLVVAADAPWAGRLLFDVPRHERHLHLPINYPRLNEFPEWFTLEAGRRYTVGRLGAEERTMSAEELELGLSVALENGALSQYITVHVL
jgi:hypothetical protein